MNTEFYIKSIENLLIQVEKLKEENQLLWVQRMNNIRARAEKIVREEMLR